MVMKLDKVLCCMILFTILALIVHGCGPANKNLGLFVCSFDVCRAS